MSLATVTPDLYFSVGFDGFDEQPDGSVVVYGIPCKPDTLDVDGQGVNPDWLKTALTRWYQSGPNVREMHQPSAVGVGEDLDWDGETPYLTAKTVDPVAVTKVRNKVYRAFSIGVKNHALRKNPKFPKGEIVGGDIVEVSLVDRPAIPGSDILDFKGDLFKIASAISPDEVLDHQQGVVWRRVSDLIGDDHMGKNAAADLGKRDVDPNVGGGVDRDKIPAEDFAGKDRSYPIVKPGDVSDAAQSIGQAGEDNYSSEKLKENIIRIAHRKGPSFVAELPEAWKKEAKVAESTDKAAVEETAEKTVDAATDVKAADGDQEKGADAEKDAEADKTVDADASKSAILAELEEKAARSAFCVDCQKTVEIEHGRTVEQGGNEYLVGKDAAGHQLRKYMAPDAEKKALPANSDDGDGDEDECDMSADADAAKAADKEPADVHVHIHEDGDGDAEKVAVAAPASAATEDLVKAALASLLADAGIDLGKIGRRMAKSRLDRLNAALDEFKSLAAELGDDPADASKAAQSGSDAITRMEACLAEIASLARQMANPGSDVEDTQDGPTDMGRASGISPSDLSLRRAPEADLTKQHTAPAPSAQETAEALAKSVAAELEKVTRPLVERLEKAEHSLKPASPPVLMAEERPSAFVGKTADARRMAVENAMGELTTKLSDADREKLAAALLAGDSSWQR